MNDPFSCNFTNMCANSTPRPPKLQARWILCFFLRKKIRNLYITFCTTDVHQGCEITKGQKMKISDALCLKLFLQSIKIIKCNTYINTLDVKLLELEWNIYKMHNNASHQVYKGIQIKLMLWQVVVIWWYVSQSLEMIQWFSLCNFIWFPKKAIKIIGVSICTQKLLIDYRSD